MRDADVRAAVRDMLAAEHHGDCSTRIVEEMGIWSGSVRIDVAVINGELSGYELKSDRDTLQRLPIQAELYSRLFDKIHLVVGSKHEGKARRMIPGWWGVIVATNGNAGVKLRRIREAKRNPAPDAQLLAQLLWREEALSLLESLDLARGWRSKSAPQIHKRLADLLPFDQLSEAVRSALKRRSGWLGEPIRHQGEMTIDAHLNPCLPAAGVDDCCGDLLDACISPTWG